MFGGIFGGLGGGTYNQNYRAYPVAFIEKEGAERGDKVILPPSALHTLGEHPPDSRRQAVLAAAVLLQVHSVADHLAIAPLLAECSCWSAAVDR